MDKNPYRKKPTKKVKKRKPTKKQARLIAAIKDPEVETIAEAGKIAGYCDRQTASKSLQTPTVKTALEKYFDALKKAGVTDAKSARVIKEGMDAEHVVTANYEGAITDEKSFVDHPTRLKANDQYLRIKKIVTNNGHSKTEQHLHVHLGEAKDEELLTEIRNQMRFYGKPTKATA